MHNGMPVPPHPEPPRPQLALTVKAIQGGLMLGFVYPDLQVQVIVPEEVIPGMIAALEKQRGLIPKVIVP